MRGSREHATSAKRSAARRTLIPPKAYYGSKKAASSRVLRGGPKIDGPRVRCARDSANSSSKPSSLLPLLGDFFVMMRKHLFLAAVLLSFGTFACVSEDASSNDGNETSGLTQKNESGGASNGSGKSNACPAILCQAGTKQVDKNNDGCAESCEPIACPPFIPTC